MKPSWMALAGLMLFGVSGCTYYPASSDWVQGSLGVGARFHEPRRVQAIPPSTRRIEVRVSGAGIPEGAVLGATLTPEQSTTTFTGVPAGAKDVVVKAFDDEGAVVAAGSARVTIVAGALVTARIRLSLLNDEGAFQLILE